MRLVFTVVWETVCVTSTSVCSLFLVSVTAASLQKVTAGDRELRDRRKSSVIRHAAAAAAEGAWNSGTFSTNRSRGLTKRRGCPVNKNSSCQAFRPWQSSPPSQTWPSVSCGNLNWFRSARVCLLPSFLLGSRGEINAWPMQISLKCKCHISMLGPRLHICIKTQKARREGSSRVRNSSLSVRADRQTHDLTSFWPQAGRKGEYLHRKP